MSSNGTASLAFTIKGTGSWRTRALNFALRVTSISTMKSHADLAALR